jgi:hypothetical protein
MLDKPTISLNRSAVAKFPARAWRPTWRFWLLLGAMALPVLFVLHETGRGHADYIDVDLKELGAFEFDDQQGDMSSVPERFRKLDGQVVRIRGKMFGPEDLGSSGWRCQFVPDARFNRRLPPRVQERVFATAKKDVPVYDMLTPAEIVGTFHVGIVRDPSTQRVIQLFSMEVKRASVISDRECAK